jgi:hypothetical protein
VVELQVADRVTGWLDGLVAPLHEPLGVGERPGLLGVRGRRHEEDLGADVLGDHLAGLDLGPSFQNDADSIITRSRTTSQSRLASPKRCMRPLEEPTAGFSPTRK